MAPLPDHDTRSAEPDRWEPALLVVGNALPIAAYATGSLPILETVLVYLLEPPIAALATAGTLLVVEAPPGERSRRLLTVDRDWLAEPLSVTRWNLGRVARHLGVYGLVLVGVYVGVVLLVLAGTDYALATGGFGALEAAWVALVVAGFALGWLRDLAQFVLGYDGRRADPEAVLEQSHLELHRLYLLALVFVLVGALGLGLADSAPVLALLAVAGAKTGVDYLYQTNGELST